MLKLIGRIIVIFIAVNVGIFLIGMAVAIFSDRPVKSSIEEKRFDKANSLITGSSTGYFHGNSKKAKEIAKEFADGMEVMSKLAFSGGKEERAISLTKGKFLTACQLNSKSILLLVHVPQFKRYKGDVRDSLLELSWLQASKVIEAIPHHKEMEIAIGLRGAVLYGASIVGKYGEEPWLENDFSIGTDQFNKYFAK